MQLTIISIQKKFLIFFFVFVEEFIIEQGMFDLKKSWLFILLVVWVIFLLFGVLSGSITLRMNGATKTTSFVDQHKETFTRKPWGLLEQFKTRSWKPSDIQPLSWTLLISPDHSRSKRSTLLSSAQDFLHIWMYNITHKESRALIKTLAKNEVQVKMILEDDKYGLDEKTDPWWRWIQVRNDDKLHTNFVHAKTFVSDHFFIIQTANLTNSAFNDQREYYILGQDMSVVANLKMLFEKDREGARITPDDIHPNVLFCPVDCRHKITSLINSATESLWIQNQYLDDEEIIWLLERKHKDALDIRINLPKDEKNTSKPSSTLSNSIKLLSSPRIHSKALLIDRRFLVISSINLSSNSMDNNREIGIIVTDTHLINKFIQQFEDDRGRSK